MLLTQKLAQIAARTGLEKQAVPGSVLSRLGSTAAKLVPKSTAGRWLAGAGLAGGAHVGQDAYRSANTPQADLQKYYDQNQVASQALGQQAARMQAPSGFRGENVGQLLGQNAPELNVQAPTNSVLRFLARPVHESRLNFGGDPGVYKPPAEAGSMPVDGGGRRIVNPDGTVTQLGQAVAPATTSQHTNRSRLAKWQADMDAAQTGALVNRYQQAGAKILPEAQRALGSNIQTTQDTHQSGSQQYARSRSRTADLWKQLGLDPAVMPQDLSPPDTSGAQKDLEAISKINSRQPAPPATRGIEDYSVEELAKIVAQRQAQAAPAAATSPPATPAVGSASEMERRRRRMADLNRTWNAY